MEIVKLNERIIEFSQELRDLKADSDKTSVQALMKSIKDRDVQVTKMITIVFDHIYEYFHSIYD